MDEASQEAAFTLPVAAAGNDGFAHLAQRAHEFISEHGGQVSEDRLIAHVFGSMGSPGLWRPLLRNLLSQHDGLTLRGDGAWLLADRIGSDGGNPLVDFVVLDVETTGLEPSRQRIIEIAVLRFADGSLTRDWQSLINPGQRVPAYIVKMTGIDDDLLREAPPFEAVADQVLERISGAVVVGHNIDFDLGFLNAELKRARREPVVNDRLDTLSLATRLIPDLRRPTLQTIAARLGIATRARGRHRAGLDAALTGQIAVALIDRAREAGFHSLDDLKPIATPVTRRPRERMPRASTVADRSILATIPRATGVYIMRDANDCVIYVGKAKNLRDRVGTYFSQPLGYTRKIDGLVESLSRIEFEVAGSELQALLLESQFIRWYQPRYNKVLKRREEYTYIRVDVANPWPHVTLAKSRRDDGARYFGPFRSASAARKTVDLINRAVPLRTCPRSFRTARSYGRPCLKLGLGQCLGPCVGKANRDDYMALVHSVVDYIDGRDEALYEVLWQALESAANALDFERADRLRRDLQLSLSLTAAQRQLRESTESNWLVLVTPAAEPGCREVLLIVRGQLWAQLTVDDRGSPNELAGRLAASWDRFRVVGIGPPNHDTVDDMRILGSWLARHEGHPALIRFAGRELEPDWMAVASQALSLRRDQLDFDAWRKARDAGADEWDESASAVAEPSSLDV